MGLHRLTGNGRYLDFAWYLVACGGAKGNDLVQMAHDFKAHLIKVPHGSNRAG